MWPLLLRDRRAHWGQDHTRLWQHLSWALQVAVVGVTWSSCSARVSATLDLQLTKFHHLTPITVATMKNRNVPVMMWRSQNPHKTRVGLLNGATSMENNTAVPQRLRSRILPWSSNSTSEKTETRVSTGYPYAYVHSSTIHNGQDMREPKCPPTNEWISKVFVYSQTMEYYSALKRKEILSHAVT